MAETASGERRVAVTPEGVAGLVKRGFEVYVEKGAGERAGFRDDQYCHAGAEALVESDGVYASSDVLLRVVGPMNGEVRRLRKGSTLISFLFPTANPQTMADLAAQGVSAFAMDLMPRITRAQSMDALSSMSTIAGYKAALLAAERLSRFFPMFMTAAGTLPPAKVLVIGAGVAGLQAIATCKRLGAMVEAFDVRPAVKEQVESLGAKFLTASWVGPAAEDASGYAKEISSDSHAQELELLRSQIQKYDAVITTALIPGKRAPILITSDMVARMPSGSVIVDLAAPSGGNCEDTVPGETVRAGEVTIIGSTTLLSDMAFDASRMYSRNLTEFLGYLAPEKELKLDLEDAIVSDTLVTHDGTLRHQPTRQLLEQGGNA